MLYGSSLPPKPNKDQAPHPPQMYWVFIGRTPSANEIMQLQTQAKITQKSFPNTSFAFKQRKLQLGQPSFHEKLIWACLPTTSERKHREKTQTENTERKHTDRKHRQKTQTENTHRKTHREKTHRQKTQTETLNIED